MKLFLTWLLGVPFLVTSMVMAQSLLMQSHMLDGHVSPDLCSNGHAHDVGATVTQQRYRISCDRNAIQ
jgi:hypothetical protein